MLTGGASRRMGRDKALVAVGGRPLVAVAAAALEAAGANSVTCVGGDLPALTALGLTAVPDDHPGQGPLGGLITALRQSADVGVVVVLSCDLPHVSAAGVRAVVEALDAAADAEAAVAITGGRRQFLHGAYRRRSLAHWEEAFAEGERSLHRPAAEIRMVEVDGLDPVSLRDVDTPQDLPGDAG